MEKQKYQIRTNYHTHNKLCRHAGGDPEQYVQEAIKNDYEILGLSDHCYLPNPGFLRCSLEDLEAYFKDVERLKIKYKNQIKILNGLETDYFPEYRELYQSYAQKLDYLILAVHYLYADVDDVQAYSSYGIKDEKQLDRYKDLIIGGIKTGLFSFVAHPDLFLYCLEEITPKHLKVIEEICKTCKEYDFPVEYNANGLRLIRYRNITREQTYPNKVFFEYVKKYDLKVLINNDCHNPLYLNDEEIHQAYEEAYSMGLNIIDKIQLLKK